jgi:Family of unknown function (DUF6454)
MGKCAAGVMLLASFLAIAPAPSPDLATRVKTLTRTTAWTRVAEIPIKFPTHHPQGMVKIGDTFYVSSVERENPAGHLFKIDKDGALITDLRLGAGEIFHPGGIDFDGKDLWVPVAEYRPDSRAIVYRVEPQTMKATEAFRFADHIGAVAFDADTRTLHGVSWGSRRFYRWPVGADGTVKDPGVPSQLATLNPSHYVDYQDCHFAGGGVMLCGGVTVLRPAPPATPFRLGGLELIDLASGRPVHQVPVQLWLPSGQVMTENPVWIETTATGLRAYFMPEDDRSTIYVYDVKSIS